MAMTLHEAIEKVLLQYGRPMKTAEIADELNRNKWYRKKDGSIITPFQIHGRTRNYPDMFERNGSMVFLNGYLPTQVVAAAPMNGVPAGPAVQSIAASTFPAELLMGEAQFKDAANIDALVEDEPGLYCIRIRDIASLPIPFHGHLQARQHNILYIGIASESLLKRLVHQELRAQGHGTFFRSLGAVLGFRPPKGSLCGKGNRRNYKFSQADEQVIVAWINANLVVNWIPFRGDHEEAETDLIGRFKPLINLAKNPSRLECLSDLRSECVRIANIS